jgi:thiosulfate/3-mercaptopyruvate sulfurtransferase
MERQPPFPNGRLLWSPAQLKARLGDPQLVLVDLRSTHELFDGVIPGAVHFDLYGIGMTKTTPELFEEFAQMMRSLLALRGVGQDRCVVFYEQETGMRVARAFWLLEYFGHADVHVLDGGMRAWRAADLEVAARPAEPHPHSFKIAPRRELFISADELRDQLAAGAVQTLDTRDPEEYYGQRKRAARAGTIPGAAHLPWERFLDGEGRFKGAAELASLFQGVGITRDKAIVPF